MTFIIHYSIRGYEDSVILSGETIEEIRAKADEFTSKRGIDTATCWSEKVND